MLHIYNYCKWFSTVGNCQQTDCETAVLYQVSENEDEEDEDDDEEPPDEDADEAVVQLENSDDSGNFHKLLGASC